VTKVLTFIAGEGARLDAPLMDAVAAELGRAGARLGERAWLAPGAACDQLFRNLDAVDAESIARRVVGTRPMDLAAQPVAGRRKALLLADMESTVIAQELLDELGRLAGLGEEIAAITGRAMRGEVDFAEALRFRVGLLKGRPASLLEEVRARITLNPGARELVQTMRKNGAFTMLVTGGFDCFAESVAEACGFDAFQANHLLIEGGRLTGCVREPVLDRGAKLAALEQAAARLKLPLSACAAMGDGDNDLPMLQAAGLGVAFQGKPTVAAAARFRLDHCDLTGLLYFQGYPREEFCT
jgi:phosphoserine phosphatase